LAGDRRFVYRERQIWEGQTAENFESLIWHLVGSRGSWHEKIENWLDAILAVEQIRNTVVVTCAYYGLMAIAETVTSMLLRSTWDAKI
jgi:hypothetical protein